MKADEIDREVLERYLETRNAVTKRVDRIVAVAHLLGLLKHCGDDTIEVSPSAIAVVADLVDSDICSIQECLDEFLFQGDAESALLE
ncbi:hypothetical protein PDESU_00395 [Pontiella desulfatans]|uniref:Uncharacterized protein n=1 Tax=Pontiella desulfatans TaxID=2750659 RepID=A0A6C2TW03_PONDE|nr:hypothetical protein [Pontiella desulfatans]VGO11848.1 hypothetical protein PDESU_00395 [Pontiella desulfatans]